MALLVAAAMGASVACGSILGIDSGKPRSDAGAQDGSQGVPSDAAPAEATVGEDGPASDGGILGGDGGCDPDLNWCASHCGTGPDNCKESRQCPEDCPVGQSCIDNVCTCQQDPTWCNGRCDQTSDNCGNPIVCPSCDGGVSCYSGACGCMPEPKATTCAGRQCGQATNNCQLTVNCGADDSTACDAGDYCMPASDTCCTPNNDAVCAGKCEVSVQNVCGETIPCPPTCPGSQECDNGACCTPTGCSGSCTDNCGQPSNACCPTVIDASSPPPDAGSSGDGGGCSFGAPCSGGCCGAFVCGYSGTCVSSCRAGGTVCTSNAQCCYGLTCSAGVITPDETVQSIPIGLDGAIGISGTCE